MSFSLNSIPDANNEPAYVLHRRPYRESSYLLDLFSLNYGRLRVLAKGVNSKKSQRAANLQVFQPLLLGWKGRSELKVLSQVEASAAAMNLEGQRLYCGFYLNELLMKLYPELDANPLIFAVYAKSLADLSGDKPMDLPLRQFEMQLCEGLGIAPDFAYDAQGQQALDPTEQYCWISDKGFVPALNDQRLSYSGEDLLALRRGIIASWLESEANGDLSSPEAKKIRRAAKHIMRQVLDHALKGTTLKSRELMAQISKG